MHREPARSPFDAIPGREDPRHAPFEPFDYLHFAKTRMGGAKHVLCLSGVPHVPVSELLAADVILRAADAATSADAIPAWRESMSARYGVPPDHAWPCTGTSGAVHLALSSILSFDSEPRPIAAERPCYEVFRTVATSLGRESIDVERTAGGAWALDLDAVDNAFRRGAAVYCCTHLHNPTGVPLALAEVAALDEIAARHDAWVLIDEVYRDFLPGPVGSSYRPGGRILTTGSFTKCYGLGAIRSGWFFAPPHLIARAEAIEESICGVPPGPWLHIATAVLPHADRLLERSRGLAAARRPIVDRWIEETRGVSWTPPAAGITGLLRIEGLKDSLRFGESLRRELDAQVVPGGYFGAEGTIRISFGTEEQALRDALDVLALGIGALSSRGISSPD